MSHCLWVGKGSAMAIVVYSPFNSQPVKIRDEDVGRAVRDGEGRIFYALPKSDGSGYYGAPTRTGNPKDEQRALELEAKLASQGAYVKQTHAVAAAHDATGRRRSRKRGKLVILVLAIVVGALTYLFTLGPLSEWRHKWVKPPPPHPIPLDQPGTPPQ